jgi:hypothetical protein
MLSRFPGETYSWQHQLIFTHLPSIPSRMAAATTPTKLDLVKDLICQGNFYNRKKFFRESKNACYTITYPSANDQQLSSSTYMNPQISRIKNTTAAAFGQKQNYLCKKS